MSFRNKLYSDLVFHSPLPASECIRILRDSDLSYGDPLNPGLAESRLLEDGRILLIFKGTRFGKAMRMEYLAIIADKPVGCLLTLSFHQERCGMPPMIFVREIELFMGEKLDAILKTTN